MTTPSVTETTPDSIASRSPAGEYGAATKRLTNARNVEAAARLLLANATASRMEADTACTRAAARLAVHLDA